MKKFQTVLQFMCKKSRKKILFSGGNRLKDYIPSRIFLVSNKGNNHSKPIHGSGNNVIHSANFIIVCMSVSPFF